MKRYDKPIDLLIDKKPTATLSETVSKIEKKLKAAGIKIEDIKEPDSVVSKAI
jgi:hypothetical protein